MKIDLGSKKNLFLTRFIFCMLTIPVTSLLVSGCYFELAKTNYLSFNEITIPKDFTFATSRTVNFDLTMSQHNPDDDSAVLTIPFANSVVNVVSQDAAGDHILGAGTTDSDGNTSFDTIIPNAVTSVVIRPERNILVEYDQSLPLGTTSVRLNLSPDSVSEKSFFMKSIHESTGKDAVPPTRTPFESLSGYLMLSAYETKLGVPSGLATPRAFKQSFIDDVGAAFPEYKKVPDTNPSYITVGDLSNTNLKENAEVSVTFISEGAGYLNTLCYFVYKTSEKPTSAPAKDQIVIIFPNASALYSGGGLKSGDTMKLRNPIKTIGGLDNPYYQTTVFNAGYTISWVIIPNGYKTTSISDALVGKFYSLWSLNPESGTQFNKAHAALLLYNNPPYSDTTGATVSKDDDAIFLLGFEDLNRATGDNDFNDCIFTVQSTPFTAVETVGMPVAKKLSKDDRDGDTVIDIYDEYPDDIKRSSSVSYPSTTAYGTAMFEDLWPSIGDFDFNDLVADYRFKTVRNATGDAVELIANFKVRAAGGDRNSGLAFTLPVDSSTVSSVSYITASRNWKITDDLKPFKREATIGVEKNGTSLTVPIFDSAHDMFDLAEGTDRIINTKADADHIPAVPITVTVTFKPGVTASRISGAALDIFLVAITNDGKRKEVHTIGNKPTIHATGSALFQTYDDDSSASITGLFYKSKKTAKSSAGAPWGLVMPLSTGYPLEKAELATCYKHFGEWVVSAGANYPDWYNPGKAGYVDSTLLYTKE